MSLKRSKTSTYRRVDSVNEGGLVRAFTSYSRHKKRSMTGTQQSDILYYDVRTKASSSMLLPEAREFLRNQNYTGGPYVMIFIALDDDSLLELRKAIKLHPLIDLECESSWFNNKDSVLEFDDYLLTTFNNADYSTNEAEYTQSIKIIKFSNSMLIFTDGDLECIDKIFKNEGDLIANENFQRRLKTLVAASDSIGNEDEFWFEIGEEQGCTEIEGIFNKVLETIYNRLGSFIENINKDASICEEECKVKDKDPKERIDFITKLSANEKKLIYLFDLVSPKLKAIKKLIKSKLITNGMKYYLRSFLSKTEVFQQRLRMTKNLLNTAEKIYSVHVDKTLTDSSSKLNTVSQVFTAVSAIFLPINLMAGYFGMNVTIIGENDNNYNAFLSLVSTAVGIIIVLTIFYKIKGWI